MGIKNVHSTIINVKIKCSQCNTYLQILYNAKYEQGKYWQNYSLVEKNLDNLILVSILNYTMKPMH